MKTRSGFVSNSSSSSFVLIGFLLDDTEFSQEELIHRVYTDKELDDAGKESYYNKLWNEMDEDERHEVERDLMINGRISILHGREEGIPKGQIGIGKMIDAENDSVTDIHDVISELSFLGISSPLQVITGSRMT